MNEVREHCICLFKQYFSEKKSINIERSIYNFCIQLSSQKNISKSWQNPLFEHIYKLKSLAICKYVQDPSIKRKIETKEILPKDLAFISENNSTQNDVQIEDDVKDGIFQCRKCGSKKTTYYSLQTRSADEPMTNFITCVVCKNRWKM